MNAHIAENQREAFEQAISKYTIGFVFPGDIDQQHVATASGVAVAWAKKRLIVTAKHVLQDVADDAVLQMILPLKGSLNRDDDTRVPSTRSEAVWRPYTRITRSETHDLLSSK